MILLPREAISTCAAVFRVVPGEPERGNVPLGGQGEVPHRLVGQQRFRRQARRHEPRISRAEEPPCVADGDVGWNPCAAPERTAGPTIRTAIGSPARVCR